jgi:hypothetical protein
MRRILITAALLVLAPACVHAQAASTNSDARATHATPRKPHSAFGDVIRELTRAAQEQAAATKAATPAATAAPSARKGAKASNTPAVVPATAPVALADSRQS